MTSGRYNNLLKATCRAPIYDTVMFDLGAIVVAPTLGSIIPHWVLAIPKQEAPNFSVWSGDNRTAPTACITEIARLTGREPQSVIWFEHGANSSGSAVGCGVDHAHIHILLAPPFSFRQFKKAAKEAVVLPWEEGSGNPYHRIGREESYLVAGAGDEYLVARSVERAGS